MSIINFPLLYVPDPVRGRPLGGGKIYVGEPDLDPISNPKQLRIVQEDGTKVEVNQPFELSFGGVPTYNGAYVRLDVEGDFSMKIFDNNNGSAYYIENVYEGNPITIDYLRDQNYIVSKTLAEAIADTTDYIGKQYLITDLDNALYEVVAASDSDGWYQTGLASGNKIRHIAKSDHVTVDELLQVTDSVTDCLEAFDYAKTLNLPIFLNKMYALSDSLTIGDGAFIYGNSRESSGFIAIAPFGTLSNRSLVDIEGDNVQLYNFKSDADNLGDAGVGIRYNCVAVRGDSKNFSIRSVDVYNATGYGHVTFGVQADPQITGYYEDCHSTNCQVLFEQIAALKVDLYSCRGFGKTGRTAECFHPYAASKEVNYINCSAETEQGSGINIVTTLGYPVGKIKFIECDVYTATTQSAVNLALTSGDLALIDVEFIGGTYRSSGGASLSCSSDVKIKAIGATFDGRSGFNFPPLSLSADVTFTDCVIRAEGDSASATIIALKTNGHVPKIIGGTIEAINNTGNAVAVSGEIDETAVTKIPFVAGGALAVLNETSGVFGLTADGSNGYVNIPSPSNITDLDKMSLSLSYNNSSDAYSADYAMSWYLVTPQLIRVRVKGLSTGNINYRLTNFI